MNLPVQLIDTHVHINFETFEPDLDAVAARWREAGVVRLVHSCVEPSEFSRIQAIADRFPEVAFAVGLHPLDVSTLWTNALAEEIKALAKSDVRVVAIGETGLDFFKADNPDQQILALNSQLEIAAELDLPVIIHCRDAAVQMADCLRQFKSRGKSVRGVMHCWGLLIETDCPFLSPVPKRGEKRNEPSYVQHVAHQLAHLRAIPVETIAMQTTLNACRLFGLELIQDPVPFLSLLNL